MIIYKITNLLDGKVYVGQTARTLEARIDQHKRRSASAISKAIKKYGWENFKAEVIEECKTRDQLNEREIYWIKFYDCIAPKGYNLHPGGRNHAMTEETRRRASEAQKSVMKILKRTGNCLLLKGNVLKILPNMKNFQGRRKNIFPIPKPEKDMPK